MRVAKFIGLYPRSNDLEFERTAQLLRAFFVGTSLAQHLSPNTNSPVKGCLLFRMREYTKLVSLHPFCSSYPRCKADAKSLPCSFPHHTLMVSLLGERWSRQIHSLPVQVAPLYTGKKASVCRGQLRKTKAATL